MQELLDYEEKEQKRSELVEKILDEIANMGLVIVRPVTRADQIQKLIELQRFINTEQPK